MKKINKTKKASKDKVLSITELELKNPNIKRAISNLIMLRSNFHASEPFFPISKAELAIMPMLSLFTPVSEYKKKYPREVGKLRGKIVCLKEE